MDDEMHDLSTYSQRNGKKTQCQLLHHFQKRWRREYFTSFCENHWTAGKDGQEIKVGDVVIIHYHIPRINWKLAVVERLMTGLDVIIRAAEIRITGGKTNLLIIRIFPLEINQNEDQDEQPPETPSTDAMDKVTSPVTPVPYQCSIPARKATIAACTKKLKEWTGVLHAAMQDVTD